MTHRDAKIIRFKNDIRKQESIVREARKHLQFVFAKHQTNISKAETDLARIKIEADEEYERAKAEVEREEIFLDSEKAALQALEDNATDSMGDL